MTGSASAGPLSCTDTGKGPPVQPPFRGLCNFLQVASTAGSTTDRDESSAQSQLPEPAAAPYGLHLTVGRTDVGLAELDSAVRTM